MYFVVRLIKETFYFVQVRDVLANYFELTGKWFVDGEGAIGREGTESNNYTRSQDHPYGFCNYYLYYY